jgi:acyl-CoA thioesterase
MLVAGAVEAVPSEADLTVSRLTVELERPVPLMPLTVAAEVTRPGRKVRVVDVTVRTDDGTRVARARALQQRLAPVDLSGQPLAAAVPPPPEGPDGIERVQTDWGSLDDAFHVSACEHRYVSGSFDRLGPVVVWIRVVVDFVEGTPPTPLQRVAGASDFGNGVSAVLPFGEYRFINPDLTVHLDRPPRDEWTCLAARTYASPDGVGLAESELFDRSGRLGRSLQSLLLEEG